MAKNNDGASMLGALADNYGKNLKRRGEQEQTELEARRVDALNALASEREALLTSGSKYDLRGNPVEQRISEIDSLLGNIKSAQGKSLSETAPGVFQKAGRLVGDVAEQILGGQALADVMTPSDASEEVYRRNQGLATLVPAVASLGRSMPGRVFRTGKAFVKAGQNTSSFGEALSQARAASAPKAAATASRGFGSLTPAAEGGGVGAPEMIRKASGSKLVSDSQALQAVSKGKNAMQSAMTGAERIQAQPFIEAAGGDVQRGISAYQAWRKGGGKNVANPSPSAASIASPSGAAPSAAGNQHVSPRGASGQAASAPAPAPAPNLPTADATVPSSSTLSKLLKSAGLVGGGVTAGMGLQSLIGGAQEAVNAEQAAQQIPQQPQQLQLPLDDSANVASAYGAANTGSVPNAVQQQGPSLDAQILALMGGQQAPAAESGPIISDAEIAQIQKLVNSFAPQQPTQEAAPVEKPSLTSQIFSALGKGLIAGGTGDPRAAFVDEENARQEALAQEQLRQSRQQFSPQQQFMNQILAQVLGNRMGVSGQKELQGSQNQFAAQAQGRQLAAQLLMMDREQQNALARGDRQYAQQLELQKREASARLEQIKAQTTGQLEYMLNPEIQKLLSQMAGGSNVPNVNVD